MPSMITVRDCWNSCQCTWQKRASSPGRARVGARADDLHGNVGLSVAAVRSARCHQIVVVLTARRPPPLMQLVHDRGVGGLLETKPVDDRLRCPVHWEPLLAVRVVAIAAGLENVARGF